MNVGRSVDVKRVSQHAKLRVLLIFISVKKTSDVDILVSLTIVSWMPVQVNVLCS